MAVKPIIASIAVASWKWTLAALIAGAFVWLVALHTNTARPCESKPCFALLDKRLTELEAAMECKNNSCDRFKGKDAAAMEKRMRDDMATLRSELMTRIDKRD